MRGHLSKHCLIKAGRNLRRGERIQFSPQHGLIGNKLLAGLAVSGMIFQGRRLLCIQAPRHIIQQRLRLGRVDHRTSVLILFHCKLPMTCLVCLQAMCDNRIRSVSYARNNKDFTADSEHFSTRAMVAYSSS